MKRNGISNNLKAALLWASLIASSNASGCSFAPSGNLSFSTNNLRLEANNMTSVQLAQDKFSSFRFNAFKNLPLVPYVKPEFNTPSLQCPAIKVASATVKGELKNLPLVPYVEQLFNTPSLQCPAIKMADITNSTSTTNIENELTIEDEPCNLTEALNNDSSQPLHSDASTVNGTVTADFEPEYSPAVLQSSGAEAVTENVLSINEDIAQSTKISSKIWNGIATTTTGLVNGFKSFASMTYKAYRKYESINKKFNEFSEKKKREYKAYAQEKETEIAYKTVLSAVKSPYTVAVSVADGLNNGINLVNNVFYGLDWVSGEFKEKVGPLFGRTIGRLGNVVGEVTLDTLSVLKDVASDITYDALRYARGNSVTTSSEQ